MPKQVTMLMGGREYTITEKPFGAQEDWAEKLEKSRVMRLLQSLDGLVDDLVDFINSKPDDGSWSDMDLGKAISLARVVPSTAEAMIHVTRDINALIFEYEPKLRAERKWLESNAYQEEMNDAFWEILKFVFPIMGVWERVSGSAARQTPGNSPSANGASSGLPASGPKKKSSRTS